MVNFDAESYFSEVARGTATNSIRAVMQKAEGKKDILQLSGGKPHENVFPIGGRIEVDLRSISHHFDEVERSETFNSDGSSSQSDSDDELNTESKTTLHEFGGSSRTASQLTAKVNLSADLALNYNGFTYNKGLPSFLALCREKLLAKYHPDIDWNRFDSCIISGATDGLSKIVEVFTNPGDIIIVEKYSYSGMESCAKAFGRLVLPVEMDEFGVNPAELRKLLQRIQGPFARTTHRAKLLYVIPNGQNPTTTTMPLKRKLEIYTICSEHKLLIVDDDPYFCLRLGGLHEQIKMPDEKSFSELDTDGRVLRLDSFSKIMAPGFRLGIFTARKEFAAKFATFAQITSWGLSGVNQGIMEAIIKSLGDKGLEKHLLGLRQVYTERRDALVSALREELKPGAASFQVPKHGMFLWLTVPGVKDTNFLVDYFLHEKVSLVPGSCFSPVGAPSDSFRISFSCATPAEFKLAARRIAAVLNNLDDFKRKSTSSEMRDTEETVDILDKLLSPQLDKNKMILLNIGFLAGAFACGVALGSLLLGTKKA